MEKKFKDIIRTDQSAHSARISAHSGDKRSAKARRSFTLTLKEAKIISGSLDIYVSPL